MKKLLLLVGFAFVAISTSCSSNDDDKKTEEVAKTNLRVVVAVLDKDGNALNVQSADANKTKDYVTAGSGYQHRVLIEDFTGAWCGWCPRVSHSIEELEKSDNDKIVAVALHNGDKFVFSPHEGNLSNALWTKFQATSKGYPFAVLNRNVEWNATSGNLMNLTQAKNLAKASSDIGIKISSELGDTSGKVNVSLKFNADYSDLKYVVYVLEDNLILAQENYTTNYGGKGKKAEFVHNAVAKAVNNINGEAVTNSSKGSEFNSSELSFTYKKFAK